MNSDHKRLLHVLAFCLVIVAVCYANSINNEFLQDDLLIVASNPDIRTVSPVHFFTTPFWGEQSKAAIYRPLVLLSYSIEYAMWGRWAPGFRTVNLLLHALNGFLVFLLARGLLRSVPAAWAATAVYLAHPVHTEAVAGIAGRSEVLAATFFFTAWLLFRQGKTLLCAVAFLLSLFSKENAISFPAVIVLDAWITEGNLGNVIARWRRFAVVATSAVVFVMIRVAVLGTLVLPVSEQYMAGTLTFLQRELTAGRAFLKYFQLLIAPVNVTGHYFYNSIPIANARDWDAWAALVLIGTTIVFAVAMLKRRPVIGFGILFFYITMFPVSNFVIAIGEVLAERYLYVPVLGIALIAGYTWASIPGVRVRQLMAVGVMTAAVMLSISHNYVWRNAFTFHQNVVRVLPNNVGGRAAYGMALLDANRLDEAREQFEAGLRIVPDMRLFVGLANVHIKAERNCVGARPILAIIERSNPADHLAYWTLGYCHELEGRMVEAAENYGRAVSHARFPDSQLLFRWAVSLEKSGRPADALDIYRRTALIDPSDDRAKQRISALEGR